MIKVMNFPHSSARPLHCTCCGRPFSRTSRRGPAPLYCSFDCRAQMRVRARAWNGRAAKVPAYPPAPQLEKAS